MGILNLFRIFLFEYYRTHKLKTFFSFIGISLGVALFITTNLNGRRAEQALIDFSTGYLKKDFSLRIFHTDPGSGIPEKLPGILFANPGLRWIHAIHPRIQKVLFLNLDGEVHRIFYQGVDFFGSRGEISGAKFSDGETFSLSKSFFSTSAYELFKKSNGNQISFRNEILQFSEPVEFPSKGGNFIIEDLSRVEERFGELRYDSLFLEGEFSATELETLKTFLISIDSGLSLETPEEIKERAGSALKSYNLNLLIISMISVLIAFFMVSNTMTGIFISRKKELGIFRSIGSTPIQNLILFQFQAIILGIFGALAGLAFGIFFAGYRLFSGQITIGDTSQATTYTSVPMDLLFFGLFIGIFGSFFSALVPSLRSYGITPLSIIREISTGETRLNQRLFFGVGLFLVVLSYPISHLKSSLTFPLFGMLGIGMIVVGEVLQFPLLFGIFVNGIKNLLSAFDRVSPGLRIGIEEIYQNPIKNTLTSGALMLAVSLVISLTQLTESYKKSILDWTDSEFPFEYSVVNSRDIQEGTAEGIPIELKSMIANQEEVSEMDVFILNNRVETENKIYLIHGYSMQLARERELRERGTSVYPENFQSGVLISSNMAFLRKKKVGEEIELPTRNGKKRFPILGIREHFFSESGTIMMDENLYESEFRLENYRAIRVNFREGMREKGLLKLREMIATRKNLSLMSSDELKKVYLEGTEKVFSVLESLKVTAVIIALISLFSSILHSMSDKMRLFGILKTLGGSPFQLSIVLFSENLFLALFGSLAGILSALLLGPIILDVINRNAFGWSLQVVYPIPTMLVFLYLSPPIAILGTLYPYFILKKISLREILSYE